jgi:hypothetical protein
MSREEVVKRRKKKAHEEEKGDGRAVGLTHDRSSLRVIVHLQTR